MELCNEFSRDRIGAVCPTWIRLHARAFALQLFRERFVAGLRNSSKTVKLSQLGLQLIDTVLQLLVDGSRRVKRAIKSTIWSPTLLIF